MVVERKNIDKYTPKIFAKWDDKTLETKLNNYMNSKNKPVTDIDTSVLMEEKIRNELQRVRTEFLENAKNMEKEKVVSIEIQLKKKYDEEFLKRDYKLERARRIINIQNKIISIFYKENKKILFDVLKDANLTDDDLKILSEINER